MASMRMISHSDYLERLNKEQLIKEIESLESQLKEMVDRYDRLVDTYLKLDRLFIEYATELHNIENASRVKLINNGKTI